MKTDVPKPAAAPTPFRASPLRILLLLIFIVSLAVPFYNKANPTLFGFPFFYWFQIAWIPLASLITLIVYRTEASGGAKN